jgi:hypothetical protein
MKIVGYPDAEVYTARSGRLLLVYWIFEKFSLAKGIGKCNAKNPHLRSVDDGGDEQSSNFYEETAAIAGRKMGAD